MVAETSVLDNGLYESIYTEMVAQQRRYHHNSECKAERMPAYADDDYSHFLEKENIKLFSQIKHVEQQVDRMLDHWRNLRAREANKKKERAIKISKGEVVKRRRRTAQGIKRRYLCPVQECGKSYGSDGSLN